MLQMKEGFKALMVMVLLCLALSAEATHLRSADIIIERICGTRQFKITIIAYVNTSSASVFGIGSNELIFGDGTFMDIPPTASVPRPDLGKNIGIATFSIVHTYPAEGFYQVTYREKDRNANVANIPGSDDVPYNTSVEFRLTDGVCNRYPSLTVFPLDKACLGVTFTHNPGVIDPDGDSISYEIAVPYGEVGVPAPYFSPIDPRYYTRFSEGNEEKTGPPVFGIDSLTGTLYWDAPGFLGEYNVAFKVLEWRRNSFGVYELESTFTRDMQVIVEECTNDRPILIIPSDLCVEAGTLVTGTISGSDASGDVIRVELTREVFSLPIQPAVATPDGFNFSTPPKSIQFSWLTDCSHVRQLPYSITAKITDDPDDGPRLTSFATWRIKVLAKAPEWDAATLNVVNKSAILSWDAASCGQVQWVQIWRRVGSFLFQTSACTSGMPAGTGYQLIATVPAATGAFTDTNAGRGLVQGATYCYRMVGVIGDTKTKVSTEVCVGPIQADAPVITHVTVEKTDEAGAVRVSWRKPFNINKTQFPEPYQYAIYRASGFAGEGNIDLAGNVSGDTTFLHEGINTRDSIHNYRIVLYSKPEISPVFIPVDTSATAATVRLELDPQGTRMVLHWRDSVPWSNTDPNHPWHYIYRSEGVPEEGNLQLIDSVDVTLREFHYVDSGQWNNRPIDRGIQYSYQVKTTGTYGNPAILPLRNLSQLVTGYPDNSGVPCPPKLSLTPVDCEQFLESTPCDQLLASNELHWEPELSYGCRVDIKSYKVYFAPDPLSAFAPLSITESTEWRHEGRIEFKGCYYVTSIDSRGVESIPGDTVCQDNCPYFFLPNIITPNGDGCNDALTAFSTPASGSCPWVDNRRCGRFLETVQLTVLNRWGRTVYSGSEPTGWDGRDQQGQEVPTGVYFYEATVVFDVLDPAKQKKSYKGWVRLVR